jgi:hypothetical protein
MNGVFYEVCAEMLQPRQFWKFKRAVRKSVKRRLSWCSGEPAGNKVSAEAENYPLLNAVTRVRLVTTRQTEKT